jgi:hypothetical protein
MTSVSYGQKVWGGILISLPHIETSEERADREFEERQYVQSCIDLGVKIKPSLQKKYGIDEDGRHVETQEEREIRLSKEKESERIRAEEIKKGRENQEYNQKVINKIRIEIRRLDNLKTTFEQMLGSEIVLTDRYFFFYLTSRYQSPVLEPNDQRTKLSLTTEEQKLYDTYTPEQRAILWDKLYCFRPIIGNRPPLQYKMNVEIRLHYLNSIEQEMKQEYIKQMKMKYKE